MFTSKYRWMAAFGTSIACHVVVFVVIGVVVALFPSAPVDKGIYSGRFSFIIWRRRWRRRKS